MRKRGGRFRRIKGPGPVKRLSSAVSVCRSAGSSSSAQCHPMPLQGGRDGGPRNANAPPRLDRRSLGQVRARNAQQVQVEAREICHVNINDTNNRFSIWTSKLYPLAAKAPSITVKPSEDTMDSQMSLPGAIDWPDATDRTIPAKRKTGGTPSETGSGSPPASGPPRHIHHDADETLVLLTGKADFWLAGDRFTRRAGHRRDRRAASTDVHRLSPGRRLTRRRC